jgi:hypothetical protein
VDRDISKWLNEHPEYKIDNPVEDWGKRVKQRAERAGSK